MTKEIKKRHKDRQNLQTTEKSGKASPRVVLYLAGIWVSLFAVSMAGGYFKYKRYQKQQIQAEKDKQTEMTLIGMEKNVTSRGCAGMMYFSKSGQTNQTDAVMHYATIDPNVIEKVRHLKLGEKKKVAEWKGLVERKYIKGYSWHELTR